MPHSPAIDPQMYAAPEVERSQMLAMKRVHETSGEIDTDSELYLPETIGLHSESPHGRTTVVAEIALPITDESSSEGEQGHAAILRLQNNETGKSTILLCGLSKDESGNAVANGRFVEVKHLKMLGRYGDDPTMKAKQPYVVSAADLWGVGKKFSKDVSRDHIGFSIIRGKLGFVESSTNGTEIAANLQGVLEQDEHVADYTQNAHQLAEQHSLLDNEGKFAGRMVITRDTTVGEHGEATVDIRSWGVGAEAIVVDSEKDREPYQKLYNTFLAKLDALPKKGLLKRKAVTQEQVLQSIHEAVVDSMDYDLTYVDNISKIMGNKPSEHRKINLGRYLHDGKGVCRQMALAAAWLSSEAVTQGLLQGRGTAEANRSTLGNGGHEWMRFTADTGEVYIIDPAQHYFGPLHDPNNDDKRWEYYRPGERQEAISRFAAHAAINQKN